MEFEYAVVHHTSFRSSASEPEVERPLTLSDMLQYAITDGTNLSSARMNWPANGVDFVQVRNKELCAGALLAVVKQVRASVLDAFVSQGHTPKLLVNGRADVAIAARADGVHLTAHADELTPEQVRRVFADAGLPAPWISVSVHHSGDVQRAQNNGADAVLFGPVFEKRIGNARIAQGAGLAALQEACAVAGAMPVFALGGVTVANAAACVAAGAAGIAGIRLFA